MFRKWLLVFKKEKNIFFILIIRTDHIGAIEQMKQLFNNSKINNAFNVQNFSILIDADALYFTEAFWNTNE